MIGKATGNFTGRGPNGAVNVVGLSVGLGRSHEAQSGILGTKAFCTGVEFRKPTDAATTALFASLARNEAIARAMFCERGLTITLTDPALTSVRHVVAATTGAYEDVTLFAHEIEFTWDATGHTAVHRCV